MRLSGPSAELQARAEFLLQLMPRISKSIQKQLGIQHHTYASCLTPRQLAVLAHLSEQGPVTMRDLASHYGVAMPTMTEIITRLVAQKMVARIPVPADRRLVHIRLTKTGHKKFAEHHQQALDFLTKLLSSLKGADQILLINAFKTIERILVKPVE